MKAKWVSGGEWLICDGKTGRFVSSEVSGDVSEDVVYETMNVFELYCN